MNMDNVRAQVHMAFDTATLELEQVAVPLVIHIKLLGKVLGQGFCRLAGMGFIKCVVAAYIDSGHVGYSRLIKFTIV